MTYENTEYTLHIVHLDSTEAKQVVLEANNMPGIFTAKQVAQGEVEIRSNSLPALHCHELHIAQQHAIYRKTGQWCGLAEKAWLFSSIS